jgi:hypothetical protein
MELLTATTAFALLVTKLVDFCRNAFGPVRADRKWIWNLLALGLGVAMAVLFQIDVLQPYEHNDTAVFAGRVLTGLAIGAAGSGWHEALDALSGVAKATKSSAATPPSSTPTPAPAAAPAGAPVPA